MSTFLSLIVKTVLDSRVNSKNWTSPGAQVKNKCVDGVGEQLLLGLLTVVHALLDTCRDRKESAKYHCLSHPRSNYVFIHSWDYSK